MPPRKPSGDAAPPKSAAPKGEPVTRRSNGAWVCPQDHANHRDLPQCGRCGAPLDGDRVQCREA